MTNVHLKKILAVFFLITACYQQTLVSYLSVPPVLTPIDSMEQLVDALARGSHQLLLQEEAAITEVLQVHPA